MSKLTSEINKTAHYMAQLNQIQIRYALDAKCRALLKEGKNPDDVAMYLRQVASGGVSGLDALMGHVGGAL